MILKIYICTENSTGNPPTTNFPFFFSKADRTNTKTNHVALCQIKTAEQWKKPTQTTSSQRQYSQSPTLIHSSTVVVLVPVGA